MLPFPIDQGFWHFSDTLHIKLFEVGIDSLQFVASAKCEEVMKNSV